MKGDQSVPIKFVQYHFKDEPHAIEVIKSHGNSKTAVPFHPADKSLLVRMKDELNTGLKPGQVYAKVILHN